MNSINEIKSINSYNTITNKYIEKIKVTKCYRCRNSILISEILYENNYIYLLIHCPCQELEYFSLDEFENKYIFEEKDEKNSNKILTNFLYCSKTKKNFVYYCMDSKKDLCRDCIGEEKNHSNHKIVDFAKIRTKTNNIRVIYQYLFNGIKEEKSEDKETTEDNNENTGDDERTEERSNNNNDNNSDNTNTISFFSNDTVYELDNGHENELLIKYNSLNSVDEKEKFKDVIKLLDKLVKQFNEHPYYNLYKSIDNLYNFCLEFKKINNNNNMNKRDSIVKKIIRYKREFKNIKVDDSIKSIYIFKNNFDDINILETYKNNLTNLEILHISENNVVNIEVLSSISLPNLKTLNLTKNRLDNSCIEHLKNIINKDCITELNLYDNNITDPKFFGIIKYFKKLETLYIGHNKFKDEFNAERYDFPDTLKIVGLSLGVFSHTTIKHISKFYFKQLETLYLKGNDIDSLDFIEDLKCQNLKDIWLRNNAISNLDIEKFSDSLKKSLKKINLRGNKISNIEGLKNFIEKFENLEEFVISDNNIDLNSDNNSKIIRDILTDVNGKYSFKYQ